MTNLQQEEKQISPSKTLNKLIQRRFRLSSEPFFNKVNFQDPINQHANWVYQHILQYPYQKEDNSPREHHGILHACRVAIWIPIVINLYRRYGNESAKQLTSDDVHLLMIAGLFHDSVRMGDGVDEWESSSALFFYFYAYLTLKIPAETAKLFAEAIVNKDTGETALSLNITNPLEPVWKSISPPPDKNILQKALQCADCLDIARVKYQFIATNLDIYKDYCSQPGEKKQEIIDEIATLWLQIRSVLKIQGDLPFAIRAKSKAYYNSLDAFLKCLNTIHPSKHPLLHRYLDLLPDEELSKPIIPEIKFEPEKGLITENVNYLIANQALIFRGIPFPSGRRIKITPYCKSNNTQKRGLHTNETNLQTELRKAARKIGISSGSSKQDHLLKHGNPNRSGTIPGWGAHLFSSVGLVSINALSDIKFVSSYDFGSGKGKKRQIFRSRSNEEKKEDSDKAAVQKKIQELKLITKLGGDSESDKIEIHEIIFDVYDEKYGLILFTRDPTYLPQNENLHPESHEILALYIQQENRLKGRELPIFEYSVDSNEGIIHEYTEQDILELWGSVCGDYLRKHLKSATSLIPYQASLEQIKIQSVYGEDTDYQEYATELFPPDINYPKELQEKLNKHLRKVREKIIEQHENDFIQRNVENPGITSGFLDQLIRSPRLTKIYKTPIQILVNLLLQQGKFFDCKNMIGTFKASLITLLDGDISSKLLLLVKELQLETEEKKIYSEAKNVFQNIFDIVINELYDGKRLLLTNRPLVKIIVDFVITYQLPESCKQKVQDLITQLMPSLADSKDYSYKLDISLVEHLNTRKFLTPTCLIILEETMVNLFFALTSRGHDHICLPWYFDAVEKYLYLAHLLQTPTATLKKNAIDIFRSAWKSNEEWYTKHTDLIKYAAANNLLVDNECFSALLPALKLRIEGKSIQQFLKVFNKFAGALRADQAEILTNYIDNVIKLTRSLDFLDIAKFLIKYFSFILPSYPVLLVPQQAVIKLQSAFQRLDSATRSKHQVLIEQIKSICEIDLYKSEITTNLSKQSVFATTNKGADSSTELHTSIHMQQVPR